MEYALAAMLGWCGTKWPGWWIGPRPPGPDPEPWWRLIDGVIGAIGGVVAWIAFGPMLGAGQWLTIGLVEFMGGVFLASLAGAVGIGAKRAGITTPG